MNKQELARSITALLLGVTTVAYSWASSKDKSHAEIAARAAECVGGAFAAFAKENLNRLRDGAVEPDLHKTCKPDPKVPTCRKDLGINKHFFNLLDNQQGADIEKVTEEFAAVNKLIAGKASKKSVAFELGILAHFVSDISQPLHVGGKKTDPKEDDYHTKFEHRGDKKSLDTSGCSANLISGDIAMWQLGNAKQSAPHYKTISDDFADNGKLDGSAIKMFEQQWRRAVNDVADIFRTIFEKDKSYFGAP